jgi:PAS domain S-box-containing protein
MAVGQFPLILDVDNRADVRAPRTRALREAGFEVVDAGGGREALALVLSAQPDLVVLHVHLPDLDGLEVCRRIKADPRTASIPVLHVLAIHTGREHRVAALDNGADAYLAEPVELSELVATVRALLRSRPADIRLRQADELVRGLFEAAPVLIVGIDRDGRIVLFNPGCERLTGYRRDEMIGRPVLELVAPRWRERVAAFVASAGPEALAAPHEHPWLTQAGEERLIEWRCFVTTGSQGEQFTFGVGHDVTERHEANARQFVQFSVTRALADARSIEEAAPALLEAVCMNLRWDVGEFWAMDPDGARLRCEATWAGWMEASRFVAEMPGQTCAPGVGLSGQAWLTGKPIWMTDVQADPAFVHKRAARDTGLRTAFAFPVLIAGEVLAVLAFFTQKRRETDPLLLAAMADIGEQIGQFIRRTRSDATLRASEARLRLALEAAQMGWWEWDVETGQVSWSPELDQLFGLAPGRFQGTHETFLALVHPDDRTGMLDAFDRVVQGSDEYEAAFRVIRADGTTRWAAVRGRVIRDEAGRPRRMIGIDRDITVAKSDEEERARLAELGRALNETLDLDTLLPQVADAARQLCRADAARVSFRDSPVYRVEADGVHRYDEPSLRLDPGLGIGGHVLTTGRPFRTDDYAADPRLRPVPPARVRALAPGIVAALAVPIRGPEGIEGNLGVFNRTGRPFTDRDEALLLRLADYAAVACRNARMYQRTEQARAEAEAARQGAVMILESISDAFAALDPEWRFVYVNGPAERLVQRHRDELIGRTIWEAFPRLADTRFADEYRRAMFSQTPVEFEEYDEPLGRWLEVRAYPSGDGLSIYLRDVTERRQARALFRAEKRVLELLARGDPLSDALEVLTGMIEEQSSGLLASILLLDQEGRLRHGAAPSLPVGYTAAIDGIAIGPAVGSCGTAAYRKETVIVSDIAGDPLWADHRELALAHGLRACWSTPIVAGDGRVLGTFALYYGEPRRPDARDLALIERAAHIARMAIERYQAEAERATLLARAEAARAEAETANRTKDRFLATVSHELRNPLASIASAVASLDRLGPERPEAVRLRDIIRRQASHIGRLLEDLLDVTRLAFGKLALRRETLDLGELARRSVETLEMSGRLTVHPVQLETGTGPVPVEADRVRLAQIVGNLLDNAVNYSPVGRPIRLEVTRTETEAVLRVRDEGVGLDSAELERIFEPFTQLGSGRAGGLGLGLAVVRGLVRQHGGTVVARSAGRGRGSEFEVRLPLAVRPAVSVSRAEPGSVAPPRARRLVVVEDSADARQALTTFLALLGHAVEAAATGEEAVELILGSRPEIALVDLRLPGIDGYEVARRVRAGGGSAVYLVALTGYGGPDDQERARGAGFDRHLVKPVDPTELERALAEAAASPP